MGKFTPRETPLSNIWWTKFDLCAF